MIFWSLCVLFGSEIEKNAVANDKCVFATCTEFINERRHHLGCPYSHYFTEHFTKIFRLAKFDPSCVKNYLSGFIRQQIRDRIFGNFTYFSGRAYLHERLSSIFVFSGRIWIKQKATLKT
jgi:hypothetical protein